MTGFLSVIPATLTLISNAGFGAGLTNCPPSMRLSFTADGNRLSHTGRAFQLVPGKAAAFHSALERLDEHQGEHLAIGEALQPDMAQQEEIALSAGLLPLQRKGYGRCDEINHHEKREVQIGTLGDRRSVAARHGPARGNRAFRRAVAAPA